MTLPDMMRRALRLQHGDPNLRLVYPVASWEIEYSTRPEIRIVTLRTSGGFHVSFAGSTEQRAALRGGAGVTPRFVGEPRRSLLYGQH